MAAPESCEFLLSCGRLRPGVVAINYAHMSEVNLALPIM